MLWKVAQRGGSEIKIASFCLSVQEMSNGKILYTSNDSWHVNTAPQPIHNKLIAPTSQRAKWCHTLSNLGPLREIVRKDYWAEMSLSKKTIRFCCANRCLLEYTCRDKTNTYKKVRPGVDEGVILPNLLKSQKCDPSEAKGIRSFWIFPSCWPAAFLHEEPTANRDCPKYYANRHDIVCARMWPQNILNLSLATTSYPNLSA